jgi:hypothetical protein
MALTDSFPTADSAGLTIADLRSINVGDVVRNANGTARLGIYPANTNAIVTGLSSMAVSVASFVAAASRTGGLTVEKIANNGATTVAVSAAPSSNSRLDVVYFIPRFTASGDASNVPVFGVQAGTAATNPTKPALPAGALELATILIPSTATTTLSSGVIITQTFAYTASAGGTVLVRNDTEMQAFVPVVATQVYRLDTRQQWSYDGSNWTLAQAGLVLIRPGNVSGGTIDSTGTIIVSGGSSVRVDDCFSTRYRHYRVVVRAFLSSGGNMRMLLTRGGADRTSANYFGASVYMPNFAAANTNALNYQEGPTTNWFLQIVESSKKLFALDVFNPMQGDNTFAAGNLSSFGGAMSQQSWSGSYETTEQNDGFRLYCSTPAGITFASADIKIYAYA